MDSEIGPHNIPIKAHQLTINTHELRELTIPRILRTSASTPRQASILPIIVITLQNKTETSKLVNQQGHPPITIAALKHALHVITALKLKKGD